MMALGGAMKKLDRFLTTEVKQRLQDMQDGKKEIPVCLFQDWYTQMLTAF